MFFGLILKKSSCSKKESISIFVQHGEVIYVRLDIF